MDIFTYENIWYTVSFWGFIGLGSAVVALGLFIMGNPFGKRWGTIWILSFLAMVALGGFGYVDHDKTVAQNAHNQSIFDHIKNTAEFDRLNGEYDPNAEQANVFTGFYGDDPVTCLAGAEPGSDKIEFGCGMEFTPLNEIKKKHAEQKEALDDAKGETKEETKDK